MSKRIGLGALVNVPSIQRTAVVLSQPDGGSVLVAPYYADRGPTSRTLQDVVLDAHETSLNRPMIVALWNTRRALVTDLDSTGTVTQEALSELLNLLDALEDGESIDSSRRVEWSLGAALEPERVASVQSEEVTVWLPITERLVAGSNAGVDPQGGAFVTFQWTGSLVVASEPSVEVPEAANSDMAMAA